MEIQKEEKVEEKKEKKEKEKKEELTEKEIDIPKGEGEDEDEDEEEQEEEEEEDEEIVITLKNPKEKEEEFEKEIEKLEMEKEKLAVLTFEKQTKYHGDDKCFLCGKAYTSHARTVMNCMQHTFHNYCAHIILSGALVSECIVCNPLYRRKMATSTRQPAFPMKDEKILRNNYIKNPYNFGDSKLVIDHLDTRAVLFQNIKEYDSNFNIPTIRTILDKRNTSFLEQQPTMKNVKKALIDFAKEAADWQTEQESHEIDKVNNFGDPSRVISSNRFNASQLRKNGVNYTSLIQYKVNISIFFENKYTIETLVALNITLDQLIELGFNFFIWKAWKPYISTLELVQYYEDFNFYFVFSRICNNDFQSFFLIDFNENDLKLIGFDFDFEKLVYVEQKHWHYLTLLNLPFEKLITEFKLCLAILKDASITYEDLREKWPKFFENEALIKKYFKMDLKSFKKELKK
jgi:hypothetical protein